MASSDPYYNRKPVPDEFIEYVGPTGLSKQEETLNRERKYSRDGGDVRKFWNPKGANGTLDPHYARKPVPDSMIEGVGVTGLSPEEEFNNRERKYSLTGVDVRKFSTGSKKSLEPASDPYYNRKPIAKAQIAGVGETGYSKAEEYEIRERKQSLFQESSDPFQQLSGSGHRQSISGIAAAGAADARRRSSAVAPDTQAAMANHQTGHPAAHSGFAGETLAAINSRTEEPPSTTNYTSTAPTTTTTTTTTTTSGTTAGQGSHGLYHDTVTDPDSVAPHEMR